MTNYSNPRLEAVIEDWPSGAHRTRATFSIETVPGKGQRAVRVTVDPKTGRPSAPKKLTYASAARIVDGDDGRTYIANYTRTFGHISIMRGDMKFSHETALADQSRFAELKDLFA
jgi:hypothetical protein